MSRFHIDDPEIDIADLEARVDEAIASKLGNRFTAADLAELSDTELEPLLRREDLPRGLSDEISAVRAPLPELGPSPPPEAVARQREDLDRAAPQASPFAAPLYRSAPAPSGLRGRLRGLVYRLMRRVLDSTLNLEAVVDELRDRQEEGRDALARRDDLYFDHLESRTERDADLLKDNLDGRLDRTADWVGEHVTDMTGQLDRSAERQLLLLHNLVYEITHARLDRDHMQYRINETTQRLARLEQRERTLERLALRKTGHGPPTDGEDE